MATVPASSAVAPARWAFLARASTGSKLFLILTAALLPLGLIALFASFQSAHAKRLQRETDSRNTAVSEARQIDLLVLRGANLLRTSLTLRPDDRVRCAAMLADATRLMQADIRFALFSPRGRLLCATPGFATRPLPPPRGRIGIDLLLLDTPPGLRFTAANVDGAYGVGELPLPLLRRVVAQEGDAAARQRDQGVVLDQGGRSLRLSVPLRTFPLGQVLTVQTPISGGQIVLTLTAIANPVSAVEILLVLLPVLMWAAAAIIGWLVVDRFVLHHLDELRRSIAEFGPDHAYAPPRLAIPSREIGELAEAFRAAARELAERQRALEGGLANQVRLTREVHHRVKNNLQVVSSLINLHARGADTEAAAAYASIQRRVDALAVVHRNHFAELEENRGIALRPLVSELAANLRATAPPEASGMVIALALAPGFVSQDVAVPVAFLLTELVELVMGCDPGGRVTIGLQSGAPGRAILSIEALGLSKARCGDNPASPQIERVLTGLSRQLRAPLDVDAALGRYRIEIALIEQGDEGAPASGRDS